MNEGPSFLVLFTMKTVAERRSSSRQRVRRFWGGLSLALLLTSFGYSGIAQPGLGIPMGSVDGKKLKEISGMAASRRLPGVLWVHNDGSKEGLFAINTNGTLLASFKLAADVTDLEDIAIGPGPLAGSSYLYLGDIGDNDRNRSAVKIYRFPEPDLDSANQARKTVTIEDFETFSLRYPGKSHDAEALLVDPPSGDLFIVSKEKNRARLYGIKKERLRSGQDAPLTLWREIGCSQVSAGDISPNGGEILLRREERAWSWTRRPGETVVDAFSRPPQIAPVIGPPTEPNGESIAFSADGSGYYTLSEGSGQPIYFFPRATPVR